MMSRPHAQIDWKKLEQYLQAGADGASVARIFGIHPDTLYRRVEEQYNMGFTEFKQQKIAEGDDLLRVEQFKAAMKGDRTMLIWLGKQRLGQAEKINQTLQLPQIKVEAIDAQEVEIIEDSLTKFEEDESIEDIHEESEGDS